MALIAQDHRETRLCAHHQDEFKLQLAKFRRAEYTLPWAQSAKPCLWNEYTSQYCYYLDAQVIRGVLVFNSIREARSLRAFRACISHCKLYKE